jgi:restriction system protein
MLPVLRHAAEQGSTTLRATVDALADLFELTDDERKRLLPSGRQTMIANRVGWARTYLAKAGLVRSIKRGTFEVTERGRQVLARRPSRIDNAFLKQFPEFVDFTQGNNAGGEASDEQAQDADDAVVDTPEERIESLHEVLRQNLCQDLLKRILDASPGFFERLVVDLLVRMGYGGTRRDAGHAIGQSGDEGIDGIIKEDRLGLDIVYIQAKRWRSDRIVQRPELQKFAGALQGQRARKGVFITTSGFSKGAREYVQAIETKIVLIDGQLLTSLMLDFGVGVTTVATYEVKEIDSDYFEI